MRAKRDQPEFWFLLPPEPGIEVSFRRWNVVLITLLLFLALGVFVAGFGSEPRAGSAASKTSSGPTPTVAHSHS